MARRKLIRQRKTSTWKLSSKLRRRLLAFEILEDRRVLAIDWQNPVNALDVNADGFVSPIDVQGIINQLNAPQVDNIDGRLQPRPNSLPSGQYYDTNRDGYLTPIDALLVINELNRNDRTPALLLQFAKNATNFVIGLNPSADRLPNLNLHASSSPTNGNRPPILAPIANQTIPQAVPRMIQLSASDPDGDPLTFSSMFVRLDAQAYQLDQTYSFYTNGADFENYGGRGEKWFLGASTWYFIVPDGAVYEWDSGTGATGTQIAQLDPLYHAYPNQLYDAPNPSSIVQPTLLVAGNKLTVTLPTNQMLAFTVKVVVADPSGATDSKTFLINPLIIQPNRPPVLTQLPQQVGLEQ